MFCYNSDMKVYIADLTTAKMNEVKLRRLRMQGNMVIVYSDHNRQALMRHYRTLANYYIADHGEFAFSGCYILFNERSEDTETVVSILKEEQVRFRFAYPYTNACGGFDVRYASDESLSNELFTYVIDFDTEEQKERVRERLKPYCQVHQEYGTYYLIFHEADVKKALDALFAHEKIDASMIAYLSRID